MNNSFGIIVFSETKPRKYLVVQRRDSLSLLRLLRRFHNLSRQEVLEQINQITSKESARLLSESFSAIWADLYLDHNSRVYNTEERRVRINFNTLIRDYKHELLLAKQISTHTLEWGFPKGKRNPNESSLKCAFREYQEETRLDPEKLWIVDTSPFYYVLDYGNQRLTRVECWLAKTPDTEVVRSMSTDVRSYVSDEVGVMKWCVYNELQQILPSSILEVISEVDKFVTLHF